MATLRLNLTEKEHETLKKIASECGLSAEDLIKEKVLDLLRQSESGVTPEFISLIKDRVRKNRSLLEKLA